MTESPELTLQASHSGPRWQAVAEWAAALALAALWLAAGLWKLSDITATQVRMTQALVPRELSLPAALAFGTMETFAAVLLLAPKWRRWGALLSVFLLSAFMVYIGYHYRALTGADCNCFPWLKRGVGPLFFVEDAAMIAVAVVAGWWARPPRGLRGAGIALAAVALLAGGLLAKDRIRGQGAVAPVSIIADGRAFPLRQGRVFLYFFNPSCVHCLDAAQAMAALNWQATVVGLPTQDFEQARDFFQSVGMPGVRLSPEADKLRQMFPFQDVPYAVALEDGRVREKLHFFEQPQLANTLRQIGFVL